MYIHQVSLQSLEAIVPIGAKSVGRISILCMHVGMQILGAAVCYTLPSTHRRFPPRLNRSLLCSEALGAMITQMAPPILHSKTLDNFYVQFLQLFTGCPSSLERPALSSLRCHLWARFETNLSRVWSHNTPTLCSTCSHRLESLFLATP